MFKELEALQWKLGMEAWCVQVAKATVFAAPWQPDGLPGLLYRCDWTYPTETLRVQLHAY